MESCQDLATCSQHLNFGLNWTQGVKAKHCQVLSTNFLVSVQYKTDTKQNMVFSVALLNWRKNSNFFILSDLDMIPPRPFEILWTLTSRVNISCRAQVFWPTKGAGGLQHHIFFLMENSILKIFGSVDVEITPGFCS